MMIYSIIIINMIHVYLILYLCLINPTKTFNQLILSIQSLQLSRNLSLSTTVFNPLFLGIPADCKCVENRPL